MFMEAVSNSQLVFDTCIGEVQAQIIRYTFFSL